MTNQRTKLTLVAAMTAALALSACGKKEEPAPAPAPTPAPAAPAPAPTTPPPAPAPAPVAVASVDLGTAVGPDQKVTAAATTFGAKDTIYAAVATTGAAASRASLHVVALRWMSVSTITTRSPSSVAATAV